jgi:hypothetical protein
VRALNTPTAPTVQERPTFTLRLRAEPGNINPIHLYARY